MASVSVIVRGRVQGVGFRRFVQKRAEESQVSGCVRNRSDGAVEVEATGDAAALQAFVAAVRQGPAHARVEEVMESWGDLPARRRGFHIIA